MKDAFWFQHDSNARNDVRILELRAELGWEGYGLWWALVEQLRESADYRLSNDKMGGLAMGMGIPKKQLEGLLALCFDLGLLDLEDGYFQAPALCRRMEAWDTKRAALAEAGKRGAARRWAGDKPADAPAEPPQKPSDSHPNSHPIGDPNATPIAIREENIREEKITEQPLPTVEGARADEEIEPWLTPLPESPADDASHTEGGAADVGTSLTHQPGGRWQYEPAAISESLVMPFESADFRQAWVAYRTFREEDKQRQLTGGMQEQELLRKLSNLAGGDQQKAIAIIAQTIAKGWKDLYKLDEQRPSTQQPGQPERGAKPTAAASTGARALSAQLRAIREERSAQNGSYVDTRPAAGTNTGLGPAVPPGIGAP